MVTIKDIAKAAGVSFMTVSNVIHGNTKKVSKPTIDKINRIMLEMNYVPNMGARMLVKNHSKIIGVVTNILSDVSEGSYQSPFIAEVLGSIEREIQNQGYYMMLYSSDSAEKMETLITTWNVDGIITVGIDTKVCRKLGKITQVPAVYTDCYFKEDETFITVGTEDEAGVYTGVTHLLDKGHRRIAFISDTPNPLTDLEEGVGDYRKLGYKKALESAGIIYSEDNVFVGSNQKKEQEKVFDRLYGRLNEFTALVFCNDYYAIFAIDYLRHKGVKIPEDVSIIGFDDVDMARLSTPRLTTLRQGVSEKGKLAVGKLMAQIKNEPIDQISSRLPVELIQRESVKDIR